jgi:glucose-6-phosphate 1-dehydrogenase/6-phosphogluconate dehydrogenase (decarboxylating)
METKNPSPADSASNELLAIFTIFGITGDLAAKKIIPALWLLWQDDRLPKRFAVVGFARTSLSDEDFKKIVRGAIEKAEKSGIAESRFEEFFALFSYRSGSFDTQEGFKPLGARIAEIESSWGASTNKLFYLAVPSTAYESIFSRLAEAKLNIPESSDSWSRILIEKPFGHDDSSARELQSLLSKYFTEEQTYRIDHYLFKEIVQGIENFRFSNNLFEKTWDKDNIERIDVKLHESIGVESRGSFYDAVGALRDVGQNHVLAMLAAATMEYPLAMDTASVRKNRAAIFESLAPWSDDQIAQDTYRAQYDGYRTIEGVKPDSEIETYFALKTELTHPRWRGVPIYMEAGKRMSEARKEIVLTLKHPEVCYLCESNKRHGPNRISFRLEPNDEIVIDFWTRKPGFEAVLEERSMSFFLYEKKNKVQYVEEYAKVIHAAIAGEQSFFTSPEEIDALWKFVDPVVEGWKRGLVPLDSYKPDTAPRPKVLSMEDTQDDTEGPAIEKGAIGVLGLGKMGANLARQMHQKEWHVVGFNRSPGATKVLASEGIPGAYTLPEFVQALPSPRTIWLMVPHQSVDAVLDELAPLLQKGDTIIEGGNSPYKESIRRHQKISDQGIGFLDVGVSGGPRGALEGACLMIGGDDALYQRYEKLFKDISVADGYLYAGGPGAGHFTKMVHNGIEYGMMQAIAEGFEILKRSVLKIDVEQTAEVYNHGSVIESRLIGWLAAAYRSVGADLQAYSPTVAQSGEGQWTVDEAHELGIPAPIIEASLEFRKLSEKNPSYAGRVLSALRNQFGGHDTKQK